MVALACSIASVLETSVRRTLKPVVLSYSNLDNSRHSYLFYWHETKSRHCLVERHDGSRNVAHQGLQLVSHLYEPI